MQKGPTEKKENIETLSREYFAISKDDIAKRSWRRSLESKLCAQLIRYGNAVRARHFNNINDETASEAIYLAISKWKLQCEKTLPEKGYLPYFSTIFKNTLYELHCEDVDTLTYVPAALKELEKMINRLCKKAGKDWDDTGFVTEQLRALGREKDYHPLYEYLARKNQTSLNSILSSENKDNSKVLDLLEDKKTPSPETLFNSKEAFKEILSKIACVYQPDVDGFLSKVITFKILTPFASEPSSLVDTFGLKEILAEYSFIDQKLLDDFFSGSFPKQKDLERSQGSVNNKWKQFVGKLLKKCPELERIWKFG